MKLIPEWKMSYKFWSVRLSALAGVFAMAELVLPAWQGILPPKTFTLLSAIAATGAIIGRVLQQGGMDNGNSSDNP